MSGLCRSWKDGIAVHRRCEDGFVDATSMGKRFDRHFANYSRSAAGSTYMNALQCAIGAGPIVHTRRGTNACTWIHPRLAIDFARWLDAEFAVWMDGWILKVIGINEEPEETTEVENCLAEEPPLRQCNDSAATQRIFRNQLVVLTEADLHCTLVAETRKTWPAALLVPGIGELPEAGQRRLQAWKMGYTRGQPDIMILNPSGEHRGLAVEFKHPGFDPSPNDDQLAFHVRLRAFGWKVLVCNDVFVGLREIDAYMRACKVSCECCGRLFPTKKHVEAHLVRKRKHEEEEDALVDADEAYTPLSSAGSGRQSLRSCAARALDVEESSLRTEDD